MRDYIFDVMINRASYLSAVSLGLFLTTPLLELHAAHVHYSRGDLVDVILLLLGEAQHIEGLLLQEEALLKTLVTPTFSRQRTSQTTARFVTDIAKNLNRKEENNNLRFL